MVSIGSPTLMQCDAIEVIISRMTHDLNFVKSHSYGTVVVKSFFKVFQILHLCLFGILHFVGKTNTVVTLSLYDPAGNDKGVITKYGIKEVAVFLAAKDAIIASKLQADFHFADVGTGTGILGISMAKAFPSAIGVMVDISEQALTIAEQNVSIYSDLKPRLKLLHNNLLEGFVADSIDVIISNPPYIDSDED